MAIWPITVGRSSSLALIYRTSRTYIIFVSHFVVALPCTALRKKDIPREPRADQCRWPCSRRPPGLRPARPPDGHEPLSALHGHTVEHWADARTTLPPPCCKQTFCCCMDAHAHHTQFFFRTHDAPASPAHPARVPARVPARLHTRSPPHSRRTPSHPYQQVSTTNIEEHRIFFITSGFAPNARATHARTHAQLLTRARARVPCEQVACARPLQTKVRDSTARARRSNQPCHGRGHRPERSNEQIELDRPIVRARSPRRPIVTHHTSNIRPTATDRLSAHRLSCECTCLSCVRRMRPTRAQHRSPAPVARIVQESRSFKQTKFVRGPKRKVPPAPLCGRCEDKIPKWKV